MQRNRQTRAAKKSTTQRSRSTRVARNTSSSMSTLSAVRPSVTSTTSRAVSISPAFGRTQTTSSSKSVKRTSAVAAKRNFSTFADESENVDIARVNTNQNNRRRFGGNQGNRGVQQQQQQQARFFKPDHADNNAVNSVPKFGRAQLSQPFPKLRQKVINPDLSVTDFNSNQLNDGWHVMVSYPKDFTFVCPSELNELADRIGEFDSIKTKVWGLSCDSENVHHAWMTTPRKKGGIEGLTFPLIADVNRVVTASIGALLPEHFGTRATLIYGNGKLRHASFNEPPVGRSVDEILRLIKAFQHFDENGEVCPAKWKKPGDPTMIPTKEGSKDYFEQEQ